MKKISVLLVEDEPTLAGIIKDALEEENFTVNIAYDGVSGLDLFVQLKPDIIVSDVMMPKLSGFEMVQKIRQTDDHTPILFLTAKTSVDDVVEGFETGGNDYLKKPFGMKELVIRIRSLLGRVGTMSLPRRNSKTEYIIGNYLFVPARRLLTYLPDGEKTELPNRESEILERLCVKGNHILPAKEILLDLWGDDDFFSTRSFQVLISRLRHRFSKDPEISIVNLRGEGYKLICSTD
nr:response regulator transcription factor [uncultured Bacteroides sp.]